MNLKSLWSDFLDLIFPRCCEACDQSLVGNEKVICTTCILSLPRIDKNSVFVSAVQNKFAAWPEVKSAQSYLLFTKRGKVQKLLHALKYKGNREVGTFLGQMFGYELMEGNSLPDADLMVCVPLHPKKMKIRSYNQSELLAEALSMATGISYNNSVLSRNKFTVTQTGKSKTERYGNMLGVFEVKENITGQKIILVDDVLTTGATLGACVEALIEAKCKEIHILTIAVAQYD